VSSISNRPEQRPEATSTTLITIICSYRGYHIALRSIFCVLLYSACDPGSRVTYKQDGNTCSITLESFFPESDGLVVEMELTCESEGENCYEITYLSGRGEEKIYAVPIDLRITDGCPASGDPWCLSKCSDAGAQLWNMVPITARVSKGGIKGCRSRDP